MPDDPAPLPPPPPTAEHRVKIALGGKRYELTISARADEVKPEPAGVIEIPRAQK